MILYIIQNFQKFINIFSFYENIAVVFFFNFINCSTHLIKNESKEESQKKKRRIKRKKTKTKTTTKNTDCFLKKKRKQNERNATKTQSTNGFDFGHLLKKSHARSQFVVNGYGTGPRNRTSVSSALNCSMTARRLY